MIQPADIHSMDVGQVLEAAPDAMVVVNQRGLIALVNSQTEKVFGYTRGELLGQPIGILMPERLRAGHEDHQASYHASPRLRAMGSGLDLLARRKDGTEFPVDILLSPLDTADGPMVISTIRDITARKQAEETLRESERRMSTLFNAGPAAICVNTVEAGRVIDVNDQFIRFIGFAREELVGRTVLDLKLWADPAMRAPLMARLQAERSVRNVEAQFRRKDGAVRDVLVSCELVQLVGESAPATISMFLDVTLQKQAETKFRSIFEQAAVGVARLTPDGRWLDVNQRLCDIVGYTREELLTKTFQDITHPEDLETDLAHVRQMLAGEIQTYAMEKRYRRKDGSLVWINLTVSLVREPSGAPHYFISVIEDITERKRAEEKYRSIFENAVEGIYQSSPEGRYLTVNPAMARLYRYDSPEEMVREITDIGRQIYTDPEERRKLLQTLDGQEGSGMFECWMRRKDGTLIWVRQSSRVVRDTAGRLVCYEGSVEDITERKRAEEALHQINAELERRVAKRTAELEEANHELDSFAHSVSHDLRAPLRSISGFGRFLSEECGAALDERGRGYLRRMMDSAERMSMLIDDLMQFAHASRAELRRLPVDLSTLAEEVARDLQLAEPKRAVKFVCAPGLRASGDSRLLRVALVNLLGNAWKYTGKVGEPQVEFGGSGTNGESVYFIRDNGAGFDMRYVDRLFGAFQRLHSMAEFEGTGVGLATVQRIIHRHGGKIWAEARVNEGATFQFTLPEVEASQAHGDRSP